MTEDLYFLGSYAASTGINSYRRFEGSAWNSNIVANKPILKREHFLKIFGNKKKLNSEMSDITSSEIFVFMPI